MQNVFMGISLAIGGLAIWIAFHMKSEADKVNRRTLELLTEIKSDAKTVSAWALPEFQKQSDWFRQIALQGGGAQPDALPPKVEQVLAENTERLDARFEKIKQESDRTAINQEMIALKEQMKSYQESIEESIRESIKESVREDVKQDGLPELRKYGDAVREHILERSESHALPQELARILEQNAERLEARFEKIEQQSDVNAMKQEIAALKEQIESSQESVKESVIESTRKILLVSPRGGAYWTLQDQLDSAVSKVAYRYGFLMSDYGKTWSLRLRMTEDQLESPDNALAQISTLISGMSDSERNSVLEMGLEVVYLRK